MLAVQIVGIIFGLVMLYLTLLYKKRKELNATEQVIWSSTWIMITLLALFPQVLDTATATFEFNRTLDLLVVAGILFVVGVSFYTYSVVRKTQEKVEKLVRKMAIEEQKKEGKRTHD